jgi:hypothetical protein
MAENDNAQAPLTEWISEPAQMIDNTFSVVTKEAGSTAETAIAQTPTESR